MQTFHLKFWLKICWKNNRLWTFKIYLSGSKLITARTNIYAKILTLKYLNFRKSKLKKVPYKAKSKHEYQSASHKKQEAKWKQEKKV